jgi:putative ABC transport system ATP-binding protein
MRAPILRARDINHSFEPEAHSSRVLKNVDIDIFSSEITMLVGPSGSGKTTLMHILGQLMRPTSGEITIAGQSVDALDEDERAELRLRHFGFIFQSHHLFPMLTATENVMVAFDLIGASQVHAQHRARELLDSVGLNHRRNAFPAELSIGQRQRVAIARALAADPAILIADEPTASLDSENGVKAMELLHSLAGESGRAVIVVTHDARALRFATRVLHLVDGRILEKIHDQLSDVPGEASDPAL